MAFCTRFSKSRMSSSLSPRTGRVAGARVDLDGHALRLGEGPERVADMAQELDEVDHRAGPDMLVELDARQGQEVVDQPRHAACLGQHDAEEAVARLGIVAGGPLDRLDEADDGGERRAQFVAGIGDEIGPQLFQPPLLREVAQRQQDEVGAAAVARLGCDGDGRRLDAEPAGDGHPLGIVDDLRAVAGERAAHDLDHFRRPQRQGERLAAPQRRQQRRGAGIVGAHGELRVEQDGRHRQGRHQPLDGEVGEPGGAARQHLVLERRRTRGRRRTSVPAVDESEAGGSGPRPAEAARRWPGASASKRSGAIEEDGAEPSFVPAGVDIVTHGQVPSSHVSRAGTRRWPPSR
jgi:hypothetical protein